MMSETEEKPKILQTTNRLDQTAHENKETIDTNTPDKLFNSTTGKPPVRNSVTRNTSKIVFKVEKVSATFVVLMWLIRNDALLRNHSLIIKYRALSDTVWTPTETLHVNATQCIVKCLKQSSWYMAELLTLSDSKSLGIVFFNTTKLLGKFNNALALNVEKCYTMYRCQFSAHTDLIRTNHHCFMYF